MRLKRSVATIAVASVALVMTSVSSARAELSAAVDGMTLPAVVSSHEIQVTSGRLFLTVADDTSVCTPPDPSQGLLGSGTGWNVSVQASPLAYSGPNVGSALPAAALAIVEVDPVPSHIAGPSAVDPENGPMVPAVSPVGTLDSPRIILIANPGYGCGTYTEGINVSLTIPADTIAGTYSSTISTTIASGP